MSENVTSELKLCLLSNKGFHTRVGGGIVCCAWSSRTEGSI